jgi:hypothetical protein
MRAWTRGSGVARAAISRSRRPIGMARRPATRTSGPRSRAGSAAGQGQPATPVRDRSRDLTAHRSRDRPAPQAPGSCRRWTSGPGWPGGPAAPADHRPVGGDPGLGQQIGPQQLGQRAGIDLVVPAAGLKRWLCSGWDGPGAAPAPAPPPAPPATPAVGGLEGDPGARLEAPRIATSLVGSLGTLRLRWGTPASSTMATWERLRCTSMPTHTPIGASVPELDVPEA